MKKIFLTLTLVFATLCCQQLAAQTQINQSSIPYVIEQPGSYILTSNLNLTNTGSNFAIWVNAPNVLINLNGFTITGPCPTGSCTSSSEGIYSPAYNNTTVENGQIIGFAYGIYIQSGDIHDMRVTYGDYCIETTDATIRHNVVSNCAEFGIYVQGSSVSDNIVTQSTNAGILGYYSTITNNTVTYNTSWGIEEFGGLVSGNTSMHNGTNIDIYLGNNAVSTKNNACTNGAC